MISCMGKGTFARRSLLRESPAHTVDTKERTMAKRIRRQTRETLPATVSSQDERQLNLEKAFFEELVETATGGIAAISSYSVFLKSVSRARSNLITITRASEGINVSYQVLGATLQQMGIEAGMSMRPLESVSQMLRVVQQSAATMLEATKDKIHEVEHTRRRRSSQTGRRNKHDHR